MERSGNTTRRHGNEREGLQTSGGFPLLNSIREMIDALPPVSDDCCIFRVPKRMRETNKNAYTPQVVSIGPLHRRKKHLRAMEKQKPRYLQSFLSHDGNEMSLESCIGVVKEWEETVRSYYAESISLSSDNFVKMIVLDSIFIIEVVLRYNIYSSIEQFDYLDRQIWINGLYIDMILLENQLPFFVLEGLCKLAFPSFPNFLKLSIRFFANFGIISDKQPDPSSRVKHFVDLVRLCHFPSSRRSPALDPDLQEAGMKFKKHFVDLLRLCHLSSSQKSLPLKFVYYVPVRNATELHDAGMKFKMGLSNCLLDIKHAMEVLKIPKLILSNWTEPLLRNLMVLEQFYYPYDSYIIDYIYFMDSLIDTAKDVDLLMQDGIFVNYLGDSIAVARLFNNLTKEVDLLHPNYYFYGISEKLNAYCTVPSHKWKATFKRDYFSTPWRAASTIAAMILLGLTLTNYMCYSVPLGSIRVYFYCALY